ncbi:hypothetical protein HUA74_31415 [Myxococcus sp. CA051A]|uniref:hypothetical protein n=1 Tax=Myxococcus sp. CA051A TaxID=2741739 RepID=UPI00157B8852|nr:hypothetical protein [Myxococcus sp. CA051A]NTX65176.1 hypothetical protein [Myxococcus sp. CA051A]
MYKPSPPTVVNCGSSKCSYMAPVHPSSQCVFCTRYYCMTHKPKTCPSCHVFICTGCYSRSPPPCCVWAKSQSSPFSFPSFSGGSSSFSGGYPSFSGGPPSFSGGYPSFSGGYPSFSGGPPSFSGGPPSFSGGYPSFSGGPPSFSGYSSPPSITTDSIENDITGQDQWPTFRDYNEGDPFAFWSSTGFPGLNVKFLIEVSGMLFEAHVKWENRPWYSDEPKSMSLKVAVRGSRSDMCRESLANVTNGSHRYLWGHLLARARKMLANHRAGELMTEFGLTNRVTTALVRTLLRAGRMSDLSALYLCTSLPLTAWEQGAWSLMLDVLTR